MSYDITETEQLIQDCEARESQLNDWEANFIDSISKSVEKGFGLTRNQSECLSRIWERITENG